MSSEPQRLPFRTVWGVALLTGLLGCSERNPPAPASAAAAGARDAGPQGSLSELARPKRSQAAADGGVVPKDLSLEALDAFIAYQAVLLEVDRGLGADPGDGGAGHLGSDVERRRLEGLAAREDDARRRSHLSDAEIDAWEGLVIEVLAARRGQDPVLERELSEKLSRLAQKAPSLDLRRGERHALDAVRARYGDEAVDRVLTREELLRRQLEAAP